MKTTRGEARGRVPARFAAVKIDELSPGTLLAR